MSAFKQTIDLRKPMGAARYVARFPATTSRMHPVALVTADSELLCHACTRSNFHAVAEAHRAPRAHGNEQWRPIGIYVFYEPAPCANCAHCGYEFYPED